MTTVPVELHKKDLIVSEVFGPTFQGEGPSCGRRAGFIRLGLCNLNCSWCDTPYTWDWRGENGEPQDRDALVHRTVDDLVAEVLDMDVDRVVLSGGEPLVQKARLGGLAQALVGCGIAVEVETNGTQMPTDELLAAVGQWNVSPKLPHSGVPQSAAWRPDVLGRLLARGRQVDLKVVCQSAEDVALVARLVSDLDLNVAPSQVWIMPEGIDAGVIQEHTVAITNAVLAHGYNLTTRLHVLVWGNKRGV
ncbi:MAG: 7-carboxy-7-deazaguanine synthase QueE [Rhodospirillales bacterium]|nr:7-carboxy-7-deazaguanine synthase QueE [Rhodospirillales bacterium]